MTKRSRLALTIVAAILLSSAASHLLIHGLSIETKSLRQWTTNPDHEGTPIATLGSSLTYFAIDMRKVSQKLHRPLANQWLPSASTSELEQIEGNVPRAQATIIGISVYDQNERVLCDYRSEFVPLSRTLGDLWDSDADWSYSKRVVAQYPLKYVRAIYPTAGRSLLVMIAAKAKLRALANGARGVHEPPPDHDDHFEKGTAGGLEQWTQGQLQEQLTLLRNLCQGKHQFDGPKKQSLERLLAKVSRKGPVIVVVLPVSPPYRQEFIKPEIAEAWERCLNAAKAHAPSVRWVRLDQQPALAGSDCYYDLAHMNEKGRTLATESLLAALAEFRWQ